MPNLAPEWEHNKEADEIVAKLVEMYPDKIGHIEPDTIACVMVTNKDKPDKTKWFAKIIGVQPPVDIFCSKSYVISFFQNTWDDFSPAARSMMLLDRLVRVPDDYDGSNAGKVLADDLSGWKALIERFGVDFIEKDGLPDVAEVHQDF